MYPVGWDMDDVAECERMETEGEIIVSVDWIEDGKHIPTIKTTQSALLQIFVQSMITKPVNLIICAFERICVLPEGKHRKRRMKGHDKI